ncbi:MAG: hypothetical protein R2716_05065 [Microthrixaceae bacterium]
MSPLTCRLLDGTVGLEALGQRSRSIARPFMLATLSTIAPEHHELVAPGSNRALEHLAAEVVQYPLAFLQGVVGEIPAVQVARRRVARA